MLIDELFATEVLRWRYGKVLFILLLLQSFPLLAAVVFRQIFVLQILNPYTLLTEIVGAALSVKAIKALLWSTVCVIVLLRIHVHNYVVSGKHFLCNWELLRYRLQLKVIALTTLMLLSICLLTLQYGSLANPELFSSIFESCDDSAPRSGCLNPTGLLLLSLGVVCGVRHALHYSLCNGCLVTPFITPVPLRQKFRALLGPKNLLRRCVAIMFGPRYEVSAPPSHALQGSMFQPIILALAAYATLGAVAEVWFGPVLDNNVHHESSLVSSVPFLGCLVWPIISALSKLNLLTSPLLILSLLVCYVLLHLFLYIFYETFRTLVLQPISLPVAPCQSAADAASPSPWVLHSALQSSNPVLQLLASHSLLRLGTSGGPAGVAAREPVFAISLPGGHPRNWSSIVQASLRIINDFSDRLKRCNGMLQESNPSNGTQSNNTLNGSMNGNTTLPNSSLLNNTSYLGQSVFNTSSAVTNKYPAGQPPAPMQQSKPSLLESYKQNFRNALHQKCTALKRLPGIRFLLSELPDAANTQIFAEAQPVLWTVQGLCGIICSSFTEDRFGVVQQNLADLLTALLQLSMVLDKVGRAPKRTSAAGGSSVGTVADAAPHHARLRQGLRIGVRTALYRVTLTFGSSLMELKLNGGQQPKASHLTAKLESFLNYTEG